VFSSGEPQTSAPPIRREMAVLTDGAGDKTVLR